MSSDLSAGRKLEILAIELMAIESIVYANEVHLEMETDRINSDPDLTAQQKTVRIASTRKSLDAHKEKLAALRKIRNEI